MKKTETLAKLQKITNLYGIEVVNLPPEIAKQSPMAYCATKNVIGIDDTKNLGNELSVFGFLHECGHHVDSLIHPACYCLDKPYLKLPPPSFFEALKGEVRAWGFAWELYKKHFPETADEGTKNRFIDHAIWCVKTHYAHRSLVSFSEFLDSAINGKEEKVFSFPVMFDNLISKLPVLLKTVLNTDRFVDLQENWDQNMLERTVQQQYRITLIAKNMLDRMMRILGLTDKEANNAK